MLPAMSRVGLIALALALTACTGCAGCSKSAGSQDKTAAPSQAPDKVAVPGAAADKVAVPGASSGSGSAEAAATPPAAPDNPQFHLKPEEGTLTVGPAEAKAGSAATATVKVEPAPGYHVSPDFPIKLTLEAPDGVKLAKTELKAGGHDKSQGDAAQFSEHLLEFDVKATPEKPGTYEIQGTFRFGVCDKDSCHPKKQPITIQVAAN